jgi:hypothetical protein
MASEKKIFLKKVLSPQPEGLRRGVLESIIIR